MTRENYKGQILDPAMPHGVTQMSLEFVEEFLGDISPVGMVQLRYIEELELKTFIFGYGGFLVTDGFSCGYSGEGPTGLKVVLKKLGFAPIFYPADIKLEIGQVAVWTPSSYKRTDITKLSGEICVECGVEIDFSYANADKLKEQNLCISCNFWMGWYEKKDNSNVVRVGHKHFFIEKEDKPGYRGFGGSRFVIEFFDGRKVVTTNLWHQGRVPEYFQERMPDNAKFVE